MNLSDGGDGQRSAYVRPAPAVAVVLALGAMLDVLPSAAMRPAGAQLRIERVENSK